jgi:hypothetical protein
LKISMYWHIISRLHVSAHQRCHLQGVQYKSADRCPLSWKENGMRAVYSDCVCGGMLLVEGMGWGLYIVTVCVVGCYWSKEWDEGCI